MYLMLPAGTNVITIIDYGVGNIGSVENMFRRLGVPVTCSAEPADVRRAVKLLLPGVGAFDRGMKMMRDRDLVEALEEAVLARRVPVLGICLGMQLLADRSEEGGEAGLGLIPGEVRRFAVSDHTSRLPIPHMGWNTVAPAKDSPLTGPLGCCCSWIYVG